MLDDAGLPQFDSRIARLFLNGLADIISDSHEQTYFTLNYLFVIGCHLTLQYQTKKKKKISCLYMHIFKKSDKI